MIVIDVSKQQALDVDPKAMQQTNFTGNPERDETTTMFSIMEEKKETILDFSQGAVRILEICFALIKYQDKITQYNTLSVKLS